MTRPASDWVKLYQERFTEKKGPKPRSYHPYLPFLITLGIAACVGIGILHVWVRIQPVFLGYEQKQKLEVYQSLKQKEKRLSLELAEYQKQVQEHAIEKLDMYYPNPNEVIKLPIKLPRNNP